MAQVKCPLCNKLFNKDKEEYVRIGKRRYGHAACALRDGRYKVEDVIDPHDTIQCCYCGETMSKKSTPCQQVSESRWAHIECVEKEANREKTDKEQLEEYIKALFQMEYVSPAVQKQIQKYLSQYHYTYKGILMALKYFYEVKRGSLEKANGRITIVEYVYEDAKRYWYAIWEAQQINGPKLATLSEEYIPKEVEVHISRPRSEPIRPRFFKFLDEGANEDNAQIQ